MHAFITLLLFKSNDLAHEKCIIVKVLNSSKICSEAKDNTRYVTSLVVSVVETTQQHLYPSPTPGPAKPAKSNRIKMNPPICVGPRG